MQQSYLTVVENCVVGISGLQPQGFEVRSCRRLGSDEQPYRRRVKLDEDWRELETGPIKEAALLLLENEPASFTVIPTLEQQAEADARVVELGYYLGPTQPVFGADLVRPGESLRKEPKDLRVIRLRCLKGECRSWLTLVAR